MTEHVLVGTLRCARYHGTMWALFVIPGLAGALFSSADGERVDAWAVYRHPWARRG